MAQEYIPMKREPSGIYTIPCEVNGLKLRFVLDTGASTITLSLTEAVFMYKNGYIQDADIIGKTHVTLADGSIQENDKVKLKTVKIGSVILKDIIATIVNNTKAPLLLGQTVLSKIGTWTIHNNNLVLNDVANSENLSVEEAINRAKVNSISGSQFCCCYHRHKNNCTLKIFL
jgi:aspartyl protease family protein